MKLIDNLTDAADRKQLKDGDALYELMKQEMASMLKTAEQPLVVSGDKKPFVILMVGVNGVGKTTTIAKMSKLYKSNHNEVIFVACDTFRAAAIDQLERWSKKLNCEIIKSEPGSDPASVAYKAMEFAKNNNIDITLIDTAGRLQNKKNLMDEFKKIGNVIKKIDEEAPQDVILVLDATSGQNAINQVEEFNKIIPITGLIMTKLDGTAKGGILIAVSKKFQLPIIALGFGEKEDDLQIFDSESFSKNFINFN